MSHHSQIEEAEAEIDRMSTELANLQSEIETSARRNYTSNLFEQPPPLRLFDETLEPSDRRTRNDRPSRKETEARRFNGKESVHEYLLQFDLTSKRNRWTDAEKALNLLCALDGNARSILSEIDNVDQTSYADVKKILIKRFGPIQLTEIHEQALKDLKLSRGQLIRELAPEVVRLTKLAYPEFNTTARERMANQSLTMQSPIGTSFSTLRRKTPAA